MTPHAPGIWGGSMIAMISKAANAMSASHINDEDLSSGPHFTPAQNDDITSYTESYTCLLYTSDAADDLV